MDAVDSTDFFLSPFSHLIQWTIIAKGRVGLENDPRLVSHKLCFSLLNGEYDFQPGSLGLSEEEKKTGNERRPQAKQGSTQRVCGVKFCFSGTHPSYWAALEGTFLRLKLDQFTATFWRVCFAESRQNLQGANADKQKEDRKIKTVLEKRLNIQHIFQIQCWVEFTFWSIQLPDQSHPFLLDRGL